MPSWWHWSPDGQRMRCHRLVVAGVLTRECCGDVQVDGDRIVCLSCGHAEPAPGQPVS